MPDSQRKMQVTATYTNPDTGRKEKRTVTVPPGASEAKTKLGVIWALRTVYGDALKITFIKDAGEAKI